MQNSTPPNLAGADFSQYQNWQIVSTPSGGRYYKVPNTAYVYDPFASAAKGKTVLYLDPTPQQNELQRQRDIQDKQIAQQEYNSSPQGQLLPVVGTVGGTVAAGYAFNKAPKWFGSGDKKSIVDAYVEGQKAAIPPPTTGGSLNAPGVVAQPQAVATPSPSEGFTRGAMGQAPAAKLPGAEFGPAANHIELAPGQAVPDGYQVVGKNDATGQQLAAKSDAIAQDGSINFGAYAQGVLGAYQLYQGYRAYQDGDYAGAGINALGGATAVGSALGSTTAAGALPYVGGAVGLYNAYKTNQSIASMPAGSQRDRAGAIGGASAGAAIGAFGGPVGIAIGAAVGALAGLADSKFGSSKDKYQMIRDQGRKTLRQNGILDENYRGTLADGSTYDFGKDGKEAGKLDTKNPLWNQAAAYGNAIATAEGLYGRSREAMATLYANGAMSNAKDQSALTANFQHFAQQRGLNQAAVQAQYDKMLAEKQITQEEYNVYSADKNQFVPGVAPTATKTIAPIAPGSSPQRVAAAATGAPLPPARSQTTSPGIRKDGTLVPNVGKALANRMNKRR